MVVPTTGVLSLNGKPQVTLYDGVQQVDEPMNKKKNIPGPATRQVMQLLGATLRIKIRDGRIIIGHFHCFDKNQNVILTDSREYISSTAPPKKNTKKGKKQEIPIDDLAPLNGTSRSLGMILVPGKHIISIHTEKIQ